MKLRLRSLETKETLRIEVPTECSLQHLREVLFHRIAASSIHLSLNRKDELDSSSPEDSLHSLGVASGDLIFFTLSPNTFSPQIPILRSEQPQNSPEPLALDPNSQKLQQTLDSEFVKSEPLNSHFEKEKTLALNTHIGETLDSETMNSETLNLDAQGEKAQDLSTQMEEAESFIRETPNLGTQKEETLGVNTELGETEEYMEVDDDGGSVVKSFSVPGFLRKVFMKELGDDSGSHHKLLVIAVHAVLLESGFVGFDSVSKTVVNGFLFPEKWPSFAFRMSLWYTLPEIIGLQGVNSNGIDSVVLKFQSLGKFLNVYGSLSNGSGPSGTHWMRVDENQLVPCLNVVWANCGLVDETDGSYGFSTTSSEREVFEFWRTVKDRIALPLLIDLCEKAGLDLPPCFMRLPTDLILKILESLPGVDIAKVDSLCSELRYLTSSDDLWKQKYVEYFGNAGGLDGGNHWKEKFAKSFSIRKRRKKLSTSYLGQRRREYRPFRHPPFMGDPRIVGGDFDLWLHIGPSDPFWQPGRAHAPRNLMPRCNLGRLGV